MSVTAWVGNISPTGATVKAFVDPDEAALDIQFATNPALTGAVTLAGVKGVGNVFTFDVTGLTAATIYYYGFDLGAAVGQFRTFPSGAARFTVALGGDTITTDSPVFDRILDRDPALFMHLGDLHYRDLDTTDPALYRDAYRDMLAEAPFAALVRNIPTSYVWDDHDYGPDDSDGTYAGKATAQQVYREHVPAWTLPSASEIYHTFVIGRVRFIQLDSRSGRTPNTATDDAAKTRLGATQKQWLKDTLLAATEPVIVINVVSWIGDTVGLTDGWISFSTERRELYDFFAAHSLTDRLLLVGADIHELMLDDGEHLNFATDAHGPGPPYLGLAPLDAVLHDYGAQPQHKWQISERQYGTLTFDDNGISIMLTATGWAVATDGSETEVFTFRKAYPPATDSLEAWVTLPDGTYLAHLDRSEESPFRGFAFSRIRNQPGSGRLEYHLDNALVDATPTLLDLGNLVWMKYRGVTRVWIIEDEITTLDEKEHETDWRQVSGRGVLQLVGDRLVFPTAFADGANLDRSTWGEDNQWRRFTNRAAGEMLWDLIEESNPRFATQIVRGTIETTGADGWTQDLTFENLLDDVAKPVTEAFGDVEMDGLTFNYYNAQGTDRSDTVIFEEGADLLRLQHQRSDRGRISYVVGEGIGEGVFAKLAVAERADSRRIEGFTALKEAANVPLLQVLTDAALNEHVRVETTSFDVDESRFRAFVDYDLGDTVRAISPSRGVDEVQRIDAIYLAEDGDRVRVALDLAGLRDGGVELALDTQQKQTASTLGVRSRQPQGTLAPFDISDTTYFDTATASVSGFYIPDRMYVTIECRVAIDFDQYPMPVSAAASGGGATSGASSSSTTSQTQHIHDIGQFQATGGGTSRGLSMLKFGGGSAKADMVTTFADLDVAQTSGEGAGGHQHTIAHTHSTPAHAHDLTAAATKEAYPASHSVTLKVYKLIAAVWTQIGSTISGITEDAPDLDLTAYITGPGRWRIVLQSEAAQPNGGRLGAHLSGYVLGAIKSA